MYEKRQLMPRMYGYQLIMNGYEYKLPSKHKFTYNILKQREDDEQILHKESSIDGKKNKRHISISNIRLS